FEHKFEKLKKELKICYKNKKFKNEYIQLGLARLLIRERKYEKAQNILKEITCQDENIRAQVSELTKNINSRK
ncbi:30713_t:CDS:1, partial [Racocetra persica]